MKRLTLILVAGAVTASSLSGCGSRGEQEQASASGPTARCVDQNTVSYPDARPMDVNHPRMGRGLLELRQTSTLVIAGTVTSVRDNVVLGRDSRLGHAVVTIRPTEVLKGDSRGEVQVVISAGVENGHHFVAPDQPVPAVGACGIWLLVRADPESGFDGYAPTSPSAELLFDSQGRLTNHGHLPALEEAEKLGTRDKILTLLRSAP